jgi:hypothetical protein
MTSVSLLTSLLQDYQKSASSSAVPTDTSSVSSVLQNNSKTGDTDAAIVDLSEAAQEYLAQQGGANAGVISLNDSQKQKLADILAKYKDAPINDDTLSSLYNDLKQAGLTPEALSDIHKALSFNPIEVFLQLLAGDSSGDNDASPTDSALSVLGSSATNSPTGELQDQQLSFSQKV